MSENISFNIKFPKFYYCDYRNKKAGRTHTHTHTKFALFLASLMFIFLHLHVFKWKVQKPTPTPVSYTHLDVYKRQHGNVISV